MTAAILTLTLHFGWICSRRCRLRLALLQGASASRDTDTTNTNGLIRDHLGMTGESESGPQMALKSVS